MRFILEREGSFATKDSERGAKALFGQLVTYICTYICINCPRGAFAPLSLLCSKLALKLESFGVL